MAPLASSLSLGKGTEARDLLNTDYYSKQLQPAASVGSFCSPRKLLGEGHPAAELQSPQPSSPVRPHLRQLHPGGPQTHFMLLGPARPFRTLLRAAPLLRPATGSAAARKLSLHSYTQKQSFLARVCGVIVGSAPQEGAGGFGRETSLSPPSQPLHTAGPWPAALLFQ